jgi:hypothetical protein
MVVVCKMEFNKKDFRVNVIQSRYYGRQKLHYAEVKNLKTGHSITDWITTYQKNNPQTLLIKWSE